jgi:uncharacterized membrane protein
MLEKMKTRTFRQNMPWLLVVTGFFGLVAAFVLTLEKLAIIKDPAHQLSCSLNPVLSCGSIITSDQASLFAFPNPFLGLIGFSVVITIGMGMFAGAKYKSWFWNGLLLVSSLAVIFVHWLIYQSLYTLGALCIYCMVVWSITMPIFWYTLLYNLQNSHVKTPRSLRKLIAFANRHHLDILIAWYVIVIALIIQNFWYYWSTLL